MTLSYNTGVCQLFEDLDMYDLSNNTGLWYLFNVLDMYDFIKYKGHVLKARLSHLDDLV